ncbi:hypothetical protein BGZ51_000383 [Haplosporangium sp. Z 767]|nr:hypothetical protein BGZ51_000383 [Haplosporangium sp. Z 767]KAF9190823.1 hypothetical protein BGZ50_009792 [Haplosporangium sp. Z 11]
MDDDTAPAFGPFTTPPRPTSQTDPPSTSEHNMPTPGQPTLQHQPLLTTTGASVISPTTLSQQHLLHAGPTITGPTFSQLQRLLQPSPATLSEQAQQPIPLSPGAIIDPHLDLVVVAASAGARQDGTATFESRSMSPAPTKLCRPLTQRLRIDKNKSRCTTDDNENDEADEESRALDQGKENDKYIQELTIRQNSGAQGFKDREKRAVNAQWIEDLSGDGASAPAECSRQRKIVKLDLTKTLECVDDEVALFEEIPSETDSTVVSSEEDNDDTTEEDRIGITQSGKQFYELRQRLPCTVPSKSAARAQTARKPKATLGLCPNTIENQSVSSSAPQLRQTLQSEIPSQSSELTSSAVDAPSQSSSNIPVWRKTVAEKRVVANWTTHKQQAPQVTLSKSGLPSHTNVSTGASTRIPQNPTRISRASRPHNALGSHQFKSPTDAIQSPCSAMLTRTRSGSVALPVRARSNVNVRPLLPRATDKTAPGHEEWKEQDDRHNTKS